MSSFLPEKKYREILDLVPIVCVDICVRHNGKLLMIKRKNEPEKGAWWIIGGRIFKGETMEQAAFRKLKEETNLDRKHVVHIAGPFGPYETMFKEAPFDITTGVHSMNAVFLFDVDDINALSVDNNHEGVLWATEIDERWHAYLKDVLADCAFFLR